MQVVKVRGLQSTLVNSQPVYYSRVETKYPRPGVTVGTSALYLATGHTADIV